MKLQERGDFSSIPGLIPLSAISLVIGAASAGVALLLVDLIRFFTNLFFYGQFSLADQSPSQNHLGVWVIAIPVLGSLMIGLLARYGTEKIRGHGIPEALEAILFGKSLMQPKVAILKPLSSAISIGSGGPFGAEGPIIMTGGAFGSLFAQLFHLTSAERKTLLVAGAAAGMSAVFATPVSAVLLSVELLLFEWKPRSLIPVALASLTAAGLRPYLLGTGPLFPIETHYQGGLTLLLIAAVVGILAGAFSTAVSSALYKLEDSFAKLPIHWMWWPALGGLVVGIGGYFKPRVLGVGYDVIADLLQNHIAAASVLGLVGVKALVWVFALASGTSGGVLAPLLIMGAGLGSIEATLIPVGSASLWALVSMAATLGGMMRSPFTACLFALELTQDVTALPAILAASVTAYGFTVLFMKRSILTEKVARRGYDIFREYSVDPLERLRVAEAMSKDVVTILEDADLSALQNRFNLDLSHSGIPVLDGGGKLVGIITKSDLLKAKLGGSASERPRAIDLASKKLHTISPQDSCRIAADRMAKHRVGRLLVALPSEPHRLLGIITRSDLLKARLHAQEEEDVRERHLALY
jgi:H+/Cl- antiporter ClcA/CBS domain-containing protein